MRKCLTMLCVILLVFGAVACNPSNTDNPKPQQDKEYFVKEGKCEYKILLPEVVDAVIEFAAEELKSNIEEATGALLPIEKGSVSAESGKYISLGKTSIWKESIVPYTYDELGLEGYKIKTVGDDVYLGGTSSDAVLYAVYGLLEEYFDYRYYAEDCKRLEANSTVELKVFNKTSVPDIGTRCSGGTDIQFNSKNKMRLRMHTLYEGWEGMVAHTYYTIVPPAVYQDEHPDWYNRNGNLCLSKVDREVFVENLKKIIEERPNASYIQVGQMDTLSFCDCEDCRAKINGWMAKGAENDAATSAVAMEFHNDIASRIDAWIKETHPERANLKIVSFAYNATCVAPCTENKSTGEYAILDQELRAVDNLAIMVVPKNAVMNYGFSDKNNIHIMRQFKSWSKVTDRLFIWMYDFNFEDPIQPHFASFGALSDDIATMKEYGVEWCYIERDCNSGNRRAINFGTMKEFVCSQLMWDNTQSVEELIDEFMIAYYKEAAIPLKRYLDVMNIKFEQFANDGTYLLTYQNGRYNDGRIWSFGFLNETCIGLFDQSFKAIEMYKDNNYSLYETLYERIMLETFYIKFLLVKLYPYEYSNPALVKEQLVAEMRTYGLGTEI